MAAEALLEVEEDRLAALLEEVVRLAGRRRQPYRRRRGTRAGVPDREGELAAATAARLCLRSGPRSRCADREDRGVREVGKACRLGYTWRSAALYVREPTGSNPGSKLSATEPNSEQLRPLQSAESQRVRLDRSGWGPGGRRFKSCLPDTKCLLLGTRF